MTVLTLILAGGEGSRLSILGEVRAKPAMWFGGKFRIIDFPLSNAVNSGLYRVRVLTQYRPHSLMQHIGIGDPWDLDRRSPNGIQVCQPFRGRRDQDWYRGTADALYQNLPFIAEDGSDETLVLSGDHIYKQNYALMLADHVAQGRDCTVGCIEVPRMEATAFGVMHIDEQRNILDFIEKPADPPPMPGKPDRALASMGIYIFNAACLYRELERDMADPDSNHDFGKDIIPNMVKAGLAVAHPFEMSCVGSKPGQQAYWRDVGTIDAYWDANIDLTATDPQLNLYDTNWPIWTYQPQLPPAKFVHNTGDRRGTAIESLVSGGCIVSGSVFRSVLFSTVRVHSYASVSWAVLLPGVQVGRHARLNRVVVDRDCVIPDHLVVGEDPVLDAQRFFRTESGITLVTRDMLRKL